MTLKIKNLSKRYDNKWVIREVSFEVTRGEILGIFGVVGVGKSTLMRAVAGSENHDEGTIFLDEVDLSEIPCKDRGFHFPNLTNDSFWQSIFKTNKPSELADGEGQALALDASLEISKDVLLLDNQFCFMDRHQREKKAAQLRKVTKEKNLAVVFATNDYEEIFSICDRVAVLNNGKLIQTGTPKDVYENPHSVEVAKVTGRNNIIKARRLTSNKSEIPEFVTLEGEHRVFTDKIQKNVLGAINQDINLAIRPEHISISFGASFPEDNLLKAEIVEINYLGATTLVKLNANGLTLKALVLRLVGLNIGDECMVGLPPDRIVVFED
jgi:ABC-type Fe3+/spermidine/putrescine transport system ATPase subunit